MHQATQRVTALNSALVGLTARRNATTSQLNSAKKVMLDLETKKVHLIKASAVLDKLTQTVAEKGVGRVETVVSQGLQLVFGPKVGMVLEKKEGAKGTSYRIKIKDGEVVGDPMDSFGGGVVNVTSFLLRVLMLHRFKLPKVMVLDESFNNVSNTHIPAVSSMLQFLCKDYGYDILAVTHQPLLSSAADRAYSVGGEEGDPTLTLLKVGEEA